MLDALLNHIDKRLDRLLQDCYGMKVNATEALQVVEQVYISKLPKFPKPQRI